MVGELSTSAVFNKMCLQRLQDIQAKDIVSARPCWIVFVVVFPTLQIELESFLKK